MYVCVLIVQIQKPDLSLVATELAYGFQWFEKIFKAWRMGIWIPSQFIKRLAKRFWKRFQMGWRQTKHLERLQAWSVFWPHGHSWYGRSGVLGLALRVSWRIQENSSLNWAGPAGASLFFDSRILGGRPVYPRSLFPDVSSVWKVSCRLILAKSTCNPSTRNCSTVRCSPNQQRSDQSPPR